MHKNSEIDISSEGHSNTSIFALFYLLIYCIDTLLLRMNWLHVLIHESINVDDFIATRVVYYTYLR